MFKCFCVFDIACVWHCVWHRLSLYIFVYIIVYVIMCFSNTIQLVKQYNKLGFVSVLGLCYFKFIFYKRNIVLNFIFDNVCVYMILLCFWQYVRVSYCLYVSMCVYVSLYVCMFVCLCVRLYTRLCLNYLSNCVLCISMCVSVSSTIWLSRVFVW